MTRASLITASGLARILAGLAVLPVCLAVGTPAVAQSPGTVSMDVSATLLPSCHFDGNIIGQFPTIRTNQRVDVDWAMFRFVCTEALPVSISADSGTYASGTQRRMMATIGGVQRFLPYEIYTSAARTLAYPTVATDPGTGATGRIATGEIEPIQFYARIEGQPTIPLAGNYEDIIRVTLTW